jgi:methyl-accepting chemotaxis protein
MQQTLRNLSIISFAGFALVMAVFFLVVATVRGIVKRLQSVQAFTRRIGEGDFTAELNYRRKDELGEMADNLNGAIDNLRQTFHKNITISQHLSSDAARQAATLQETSTAVEEMASMTKQNSENADLANNLTTGANKTVTKAHHSMQQLTTAIGEITSASKEISQIIQTIDEIAFQTNLLALNAAVEAARAGEVGAGFAVVSEEVRNLAMRSAEAAKNTAGLIDGTIAKIQKGFELVTQTGKDFSEVTANVDNAAKLISKISEASQDQSSGIAEINRAVSEMDEVTQQNAANAETLATSMGVFKVD